MTTTSERRPASPPIDLPELVAAAIGGNRFAWNALVERFAPLVTSVIRRFRLNEADSDDVRQNVWLSLVEHLADVREPRALPGWITTTTRREALRVLSARVRVVVVDPQSDWRLDVVNNADPASYLLLEERHNAVHAGLAELRSEHREILLLSFFDPDATYRAISQHLGMPVGSIGPTRGRCLQRLRETPPLQALAS